MGRWAWADVDLDAIRHNVDGAASAVAPADVWAVVKADGYGHGAVEVATAALRAGATGLCVALSRRASSCAPPASTHPILVLSEQPPSAAASGAVGAGLDLTVALAVAGIEAMPRPDAGRRRSTSRSTPACTASAAAPPSRRARRGDRRVGAAAAGVFTHLAVADEPDDPFTAAQLDRFDDVLADAARRRHRPGAGARRQLGRRARPSAAPGARLVRAGIADLRHLARAARRPATPPGCARRCRCGRGCRT